ncbi:prolipoprotein diacylglyceryl transferase [Corynebacterium hindlerae]|uniref:Phosphatidylglycerol--prolipoprotein diacylglyceryl transferase n=1 Tax=Corynebacterium hindlerae TaxID=699041 RepID=A0A7G5FIG9_9CORY|nr:prolipoprotein diacylglyceryl transferase [Corynebacterium hindlerae]QMV86410.1 prolipoprotein diacylglyceryl transferase [Corynebacterium hindlerae]
MNLAYIPSPPQGVWYLAGIPIRAYALCIVAGILVAVWLTKRRYVARGGNADVVMDAALVAVPAGIVGGRLYHVITDNDQYFCESCNPIDALKITNGGLGIWGAVALGVLMVWVMMKVKGLPIAPLADAAAPGIILAQAIGRLGNYFNQELYGAETTVPWGLKIFYRVNENGALAPLTGHSTGEVIAIVHPTFLYEMIWNVLVCVLLLWADKKFNLDRGKVFWLYVAGYTLGRFWIELMRTDHATLIYGLRVNTITSTVLFIISVACVMWLSKNRTKDNPSREAQIL